MNDTTEPKTAEEGARVAIKTTTRLAILCCPVHENFWAISLEREGAMRTRLTPRCCGWWPTVSSFPLSIHSLREIVKACEDEIDLLAREEEQDA